MVSINNLIKKYFYKPNHYPKGSNFFSGEINYKVRNLIKDILLIDECIIVTIDNEYCSNQNDCVVFTNRAILYYKFSDIYRFNYKEIERLELPKSKIKLNANELSLNRWEKVNDKALIRLKDGTTYEIRLIYGGIYDLATLLKNNTFIKLVGR